MGVGAPLSQYARRGNRVPRRAVGGVAGAVWRHCARRVPSVGIEPAYSVDRGLSRTRVFC